MAIQFICPGCGQPIEVDDEYAGRLVGCPFCQTAAEAPAATTLPPPGQAASATVAEPVFGSASRAAEPAPDAMPSTNWDAQALAITNASNAAMRLCTIGLLCGIGLWFTMLASSLLILRMPDVRQKIQQLQANEATTTDVQNTVMQASEQFGQQHPAIALLMSVAVVGFMLIGIGASVAGLMRSPLRRGQAMVGLFLNGSCGLYFLMGMLFGSAAGAGS